MKIGNLSQTIVTVPDFFQKPYHGNHDYSFLYPPIKSYKGKLFKESDYLGHPLITNMNFNRNFRHEPFPRTFIYKYPISNEIKNHDCFPKIVFEPMKLESYIEKPYLEKLKDDEMCKTMQTHISQLTKKLSRRQNLSIETKAYQKTDELFCSTMRDKVNSLSLVKPEIKKQIEKRHSNIRTKDNYDRGLRARKTMKETFYGFGENLPNINYI